MDFGVRVRVTLIRVRIGTRVSVMVSVKFGIRAKDGRDAELKSYVLCYQVLTHLLETLPDRVTSENAIRGCYGLHKYGNCLCGIQSYLLLELWLAAVT